MNASSLQHGQHLVDIRKQSWDLNNGLHKAIGDQDSVVLLLFELVIGKDENEVTICVVRAKFKELNVLHVLKDLMHSQKRDWL